MPRMSIRCAVHSLKTADIAVVKPTSGKAQQTGPRVNHTTQANRLVAQRANQNYCRPVWENAMAMAGMCGIGSHNCPACGLLHACLLCLDSIVCRHDTRGCLCSRPHFWCWWKFGWLWLLCKQMESLRTAPHRSLHLCTCVVPVRGQGPVLPSPLV